MATNGVTGAAFRRWKCSDSANIGFCYPNLQGLAEGKALRTVCLICRLCLDISDLTCVLWTPAKNMGRDVPGGSWCFCLFFLIGLVSVFRCRSNACLLGRLKHVRTVSPQTRTSRRFGIEGRHFGVERRTCVRTLCNSD